MGSLSVRQLKLGKWHGKIISIKANQMKIGTKVRVIKRSIENSFAVGTEGVIVGINHPKLSPVKHFIKTLKRKPILVEGISQNTGETTVQLMRKEYLEIIED